MAEADPGLPTQAIWDIPFESLEFNEKIGKGSFGSVFRGCYLGLDVAIKKIEKADDPEYLKYIDREVSMLQSLRHPFIVNFSGICVHSSGLYIVTEFVSGGDVRQLLKKTPPIGWDKRVSIAVDLAKAMVFLHAKKIIHRDLKSKNILLDEFQRIRLCDFGFARMSEQTKKSRHMTMCGTEGWVAPEILLGMSYDTSCDVFSYGVVLAELITGRKPGVDLWVRSPETCFDINPEELKQKSIPGCPSELISVCVECCLYEPLTRPKFDEILSQLKVCQNNLKVATAAAAAAAAVVSTPIIQTPTIQTPNISFSPNNNNNNNNSNISPDITTGIQQINLSSSGGSNNSSPSTPPQGSQLVSLAQSRRNTMSLHRKSMELNLVDGQLSTTPPPTSPIQSRPHKPSDSIWKIAAKPKHVGYQTLKRKQGPCYAALTSHITKMIERATSDYYYDTSYIQDFLLAYRCFAPPQQIFELLLSRYIANSPDNFTNDINGWKKVQRVIQLRVIIFFKRWIDYYPQDFLEEAMEDNLNEFDKISAQQNSSTALLLGTTISNNELLIDPKLMTELQKKRSELELLIQINSPSDFINNNNNPVNNINNSVNSNSNSNSSSNNNNGLNITNIAAANQSKMMLQNGNNRYSVLVTSNGIGNGEEPYPVSIIPPPTTNEYLDVKDIHSTELARQITIINSFYFNRIKAREFIEYIWEKCGEESTTTPYVGTSFVEVVPAENIHKFVRKCNNLARFVSTEILKQTKLQKRVATIERFIEAAEKCLANNDYAAVFSIVEPLVDQSIERLSDTWRNVSQRNLATFEHLKSIVSKENDHKKYRELLPDAKPPCIPNIHLLLDELSFIETSSPRLLPGGIVNFFHYRQLSRKILQSQQLQSHCFRPIPSIQKVLTKPPSELFDDELIKNNSLKCEPPVSL
ncbi:hypothetical protein ACTFIY_011535 [Dictyostelium cf. discoideum]